MTPKHRSATLTLVGVVALNLVGLATASAAVAAPALGHPAAGARAPIHDVPAPGDQADFPPPSPPDSDWTTDEYATSLPQLQTAPRCDANQTRGYANLYDGVSASRLYDSLFAPGPRVPHLGGWVPQGLTTWPNWNGTGSDLLLLGMYRRGAPSYLVGIDPSTGRHVGTVRTNETHFGALGIARGWLLAQDNASRKSRPAVRRYRLSAVRTQMAKAATSQAKPFLRAQGRPQRVYGASFMTERDGSVWMGRYAKRADYMYRYAVGPTGRLRAMEGPLPVPASTQGLLATDRHFVFAASAGLGRGRLTLVERDAPDRPVACVWTPSLPQNLTTVGGTVYAAYEGGAAKFARSAVANRVGELQTVSLAALESLAP